MRDYAQTRVKSWRVGSELSGAELPFRDISKPPFSIMGNERKETYGWHKAKR
jgi:hypothetical protein